MEKSMIEERLQKRATERFIKEYRDLYEYLQKHPIGRRLVIQDKSIVTHVMNDCWYAGYSGNKFSNILEIEKLRVQELLNEETDKIIKIMTDVSYIFEDR